MFCWVTLAIFLLGLLLTWSVKADEKPKLTKHNLTLDSDFRDALKAFKKKCPVCKLYYSAGKMMDKDGPVQVAFVIIRDQGTELRVSRWITARGMNVVTVYVPNAVVDVEFLKFLKGGIDND